MFYFSVLNKKNPKYNEGGRKIKFKKKQKLYLFLEKLKRATK